MADPCFKHLVAMKLFFYDDTNYGDTYLPGEALKTKEAHYNDPDKLDFPYSGLLKEGVKNLCKKDNDLIMRDFPEDIRKRCIINIVEGKDNRSIFFEIINPDKERKKNKTICVKGTTEVFQCIDKPTKKDIIPDHLIELIEHAPMNI